MQPLEKAPVLLYHLLPSPGSCPTNHSILNSSTRSRSYVYLSVAAAIVPKLNTKKNATLYFPMNVNYLSLFLFLHISIVCFSQANRRSETTDITKATFFNPGISYEKAIARSQSLYAQAFMNTAFGIGYSSSLGNTSFIYFDPALTVQYRYYYNYAKREAREKRTAMNSLNYVCSILQTVFSKESIADSYYRETKRRAIHTFGLAWGFQRNYKNRFSLDLSLGGGYLYTKATTLNDMGQFISKNVGRFTTAGQFNLGFWLNKKK